DSDEKLKNEEEKLKGLEKQKLNEIESNRESFKLLRENVKKDSDEKLKNEEEKLKGLEKKELSEKLERKRISLEKEYVKKMEAEKKSLKQHFDEEVLIHQAILDKKMHEHLTIKTKELHEKYKNLQQDELEKMEKLGEREKKLKIKERNYKKIILEKLEKQKHKETEEMIREQSKIIKERLKKEFEERLSLVVKAKEAEFEKKKSELDLEILNKARQLFV
ncbi:MAG: hypothetical protein AABW90_02265, partial [Nanoarchaeota archaeon]